MAEIALRAGLPWCARRRRIVSRGLRLDLRGRALQLLERRLALVRRQLLRPLAIHKADQFQVQMLQTEVARRQRLILTRQAGLLLGIIYESAHLGVDA